MSIIIKYRTGVDETDYALVIGLILTFCSIALSLEYLPLPISRGIVSDAIDYTGI